MEKINNLIVGCGLSGAILAERLANECGEKSLIIDKRNHIGGNIYDFKDQNGITIQQYGPHVFHTNYKEVWDYLSRFTSWHYFMYRVKAIVDGIEVNIPFNLDSIYKVFPDTMAKRLEVKLIDTFGFNKKIPILELRKTEDRDLEFLANYIYEKVFLGYTVKQWGVKPEDLDPSVSARVPVYISRDDRYFQDKYQAIPEKGYTSVVKNILDNPKIEVRLNTDFKDVKNKIEYKRLFYSGPIDEFFNYDLGRLPYISLDFKFIEFNKEYYQSGPQINTPENYDFTRSVEYKYYLDEKSDKTVVSFEYPGRYEEGKSERYYPIPLDANHDLYNKYLEKTKSLKEEIYFFGRLGDYKYYNMDETVKRALELFERVR